ncbi:ABC-type multidrug transport system fused ATPase/permease subunit [Catenulispora sp. GP43]|uniref:ABC transporter ATP-binding protein n=1 Tax=Catenulispora sp. GP43 TaxID=3156263 RepID=UPI003510D764
MRILNDRLLLFRSLGSGGLPVAVLLGTALVASACIPAATAAALGFMVSRLTTSTASDLFGAALLPLVLFGCVLFAGHLADAAVKPLEFQVRTRVDGRHRTRVLSLTTGVPSIGPLEDPTVQRLIRRTSAEPEHGATTPADGAIAQLRWGAGLIGAIAACAVVARYEWWLVPLLIVPALVGLYLRAHQYGGAVMSLQSAMKEEMHADVWRNAASSAAEGKDVRVFGFADWMVERMQTHVEAGNMPFWRHVSGVAARSWLQFALVMIGLCPAYILVSLDAAHGRTALAVQTAVLLAGWTVYSSVGSGDVVYQMAGSVEVLRSFEKLDAALSPLIAAPDTAEPAATMPGAPQLIRFEDVSFHYPGTDRAVLDHIDLEIRPGELLAIVGLNGAGKSTLIKLLSGLYTPDSGRITADGKDIGAQGWDAWRSRVSVVFQDFIRYELSAADNVTLGQAYVPADQAAADDAAVAAGFDDVLAKLPNGWQTPLARGREGGVDLSGGQWQQAVLARALYAVRKGARLLVLDEPTAHLDVRTEFEVFHRLAEHRGDTGVVLISHRLSTVRQADRIVLLENGRITEAGDHDELMALGGSYAELFTVQAKSLLRTEDAETEAAAEAEADAEVEVEAEAEPAGATELEAEPEGSTL